jgi:hypothetical protein
VRARDEGFELDGARGGDERVRIEAHQHEVRACARRVSADGMCGERRADACERGGR